MLDEEGIGKIFYASDLAKSRLTRSLHTARHHATQSKDYCAFILLHNLQSKGNNHLGVLNHLSSCIRPGSRTIAYAEYILPNQRMYKVCEVFIMMQNASTPKLFSKLFNSTISLSHPLQSGTLSNSSDVCALSLAVLIISKCLRLARLNKRFVNASE